MKVVSYTALHYGSDYLYHAIKSVIDHVDEHWIIYSDVGSHGSRTNLRCPDTRDELMAIAAKAAGSKLGWVDGRWDRETDQRSMIHQLAPDADVILVVDADEIWPTGLVHNVTDGIDYAFLAQRNRVTMRHYWRSFYRCILHDPASPVRIICPKKPDSEMGLTDLWGSINHFGYAQRPEIVRYKLETHGHRAEFRRDVDWFTDIFLANRQRDCHPVGSEWWNPETVNPLDYMPSWMSEHPYFNLEVIE